MNMDNKKNITKIDTLSYKCNKSKEGFEQKLRKNSRMHSSF